MVRLAFAWALVCRPAVSHQCAGIGGAAELLALMRAGTGVARREAFPHF